MSQSPLQHSTVHHTPHHTTHHAPHHTPHHTYLLPPNGVRPRHTPNGHLHPTHPTQYTMGEGGKVVTAGSRAATTAGTVDATKLMVDLAAAAVQRAGDTKQQKTTETVGEVRGEVSGEMRGEVRGEVSPPVTTRSTVKEQRTLDGHVVHLSVMTLMSLVMAALTLQFIYNLGRKSARDVTNTPAPTSGGGLVPELPVEVSGWFRQVSLGVGSVCLVLNMSCAAVCAMQVTFTLNAWRMNHGRLRASYYLERCAAFRFIVATGFFVSIPTFILAFILYVFHTYPVVPAIIVSSILSVGAIFSLTAIVHGTVVWRRATTNKWPSLSAGSVNQSYDGEETRKQSIAPELSTLV